MSKPFGWLLETAILPGQLENFQAVAAELIKATETEAGTLAYEWFLSLDKTTYQIYARFKDSEAALAHLKTLHRFSERLLQTSHPVRITVYGTPNKDVRDALESNHPIYYTQVGGITR